MIKDVRYEIVWAFGPTTMTTGTFRGLKGGFDNTCKWWVIELANETILYVNPATVANVQAV